MTVELLLPQGMDLVKNNMNVLLVGRHGTGKTETVREMCKREGLRVVSFSCSTLDPFTDLVGVPVPVATGVDGKMVLQMIRPDEIDSADVLFFDELNRARPEVQDAVLEIINNRTINGEPLPNLKACWGAINPPDDSLGYNVEALDPALLDRFDAVIPFHPRPSVIYMAQNMRNEVAEALVQWWTENIKNKEDVYVSPRRLNKLGIMFDAFPEDKGLFTACASAIGKKVDVTALYDSLRKATGWKEEEYWDNPHAPAYDGISSYDLPTIQSKLPELVEFLNKYPKNITTRTKIVNAMTEGIPATESGIRTAMLQQLSEELLIALGQDALLGYFGRLDSAGLSAWRNKARSACTLLDNKEHEGISNLFSDGKLSRLEQVMSFESISSHVLLTHSINSVTKRSDALIPIHENFLPIITKSADSWEGLKNLAMEGALNAGA